MRTWSARARSLPFFSVAPWRFARISTISAPTLCRVRAYSSPGLPSPTTSRSAAVPRRRSTGYSSPASSEASASDRLAGTTFAGLALVALALFALFGLGGDARRRDLRDDEVGLGLGDDALGQRDVFDAQLVADGEALDVDLDRHRDVAGHRLDGEVEEQLLEQAAVLHAGRLARPGGSGSRRSPRRRGRCG